MPEKSFAWSWSALDSFETCPRRHQLTKVVKAFPEKQNAAMLAGQQFHKALELRVERGKRLPPDMTQYEPILQRLEKSAEGGTMVAERKIGLTRDLKECEYFDRDVWLRTVVDCQIDKGNRAMVLDWKTGKVKDGYDQLALTAAVKFAINPELERVDTAYVWFQANAITKESFVREDVAGIWRNLLPRVAKIEDALASGKFPAKKSGLCKAYCPCTTCEHNGNYTG
jgi:hypothetical protein